MVEYVEQFPFAMGVESHEGGEGKIYNENSKTDRQQEQGLVFFYYSQINKKQADSPHDHELVMQIEKPGLGMQDI
jgi:hypothetical protein